MTRLAASMRRAPKNFNYRVTRARFKISGRIDSMAIYMRPSRKEARTTRRRRHIKDRVPGQIRPLPARPLRKPTTPPRAWAVTGRLVARSVIRGTELRSRESFAWARCCRHPTLIDIVEQPHLAVNGVHGFLHSGQVAPSGFTTSIPARLLANRYRNCVGCIARNSSTSHAYRPPRIVS